MIQRPPFTDKRNANICTFCGDYADSKDHVPSKILLDEPYPENLPLVACCKRCNHSFSLDEEYIACFIECLKCGSTEIIELSREKIKAAFKHNESLRKRITNSICINGDTINFNIEGERLHNVLLKLAEGHIRYECDEFLFEDNPSVFYIDLIQNLSESQLNNFFKPKPLHISPEVGSRAMLDMSFDTNNEIYTNWHIVQPNMYEYMISENPTCVKIIIQDMFISEVRW